MQVGFMSHVSISFFFPTNLLSLNIFLLVLCMLVFYLKFSSSIKKKKISNVVVDVSSEVLQRIFLTNQGL